MKRGLPLSGLVLSCLAAAFLIAAPPSFSETAGSSYCLTEDWPNLPPGLELGQAAGLGMGSDNRLYVFHRGEKSWGGPRSIFGAARGFIGGLLNPDAAKAPIAQDAILALDPQSGALLSSFGAQQFLIPHGLTVDDGGNIWVTDVGLHQVFKFSSDGTLLLTVGERGVAGGGQTRFNQPTDIAVAKDGSFYVTDGYGNARVVKFAQDGRYLFEWGTPGAAPGQFNVPHGIAIDDAQNLYVADRGNGRIQVFSPEGKFLHEISGPHIGRPWALDIASDGRLYMVDGGDQDPDKPRSGVLVLTLEGQVIERWSRYGYEPGNLVWPHDLAVSRAREVFVGEVFDRNRIQKFSPDCSRSAAAG